VSNVLLLFEDTIQEKAFYFTNPIHEICAEKYEDVIPAFEKIDNYRKAGYYLAGYISYEASYAFVTKRRQNQEPPKNPLVHFFAFQEKKLGNIKDIFYQENQMDLLHLYDFYADTDKDEYFRKQKKIRELLIDGEIYQLNQTFQKKFRASVSPEVLYLKLRNIQKTKYSAYLRFAGYEILSFSPELFLKKEGEKLTTEPMKGTAALSASEDFLKKDTKSIAENLMIVDLLRNDLGKIARPGTVEVEELFRIQELSTVYQMSSVISALIDREESLLSIFESLFPCGSITGAPKVSAMNWIQEMEVSPRGVYTGAIGFIEPNNNFCFNVAIRTILHQNAQYSLGVGGGIVTDSEIEKEFEETQLKSRFVRQLNSSFFLFETFLFDGEVYRNLGDHLKRLEKAAHFFDFEFSEQKVIAELEQLRKNFFKAQRIKVELFWGGNLNIKCQDLGPRIGNKIDLSKENILSSDPFRKHKTSRREIYDNEWARVQKEGYYDVLFLNEKAHVAEASRHNLFIKKNNLWLTPPLSSGALPGVERARAMQDLSAIETNLTVEDLSQAEEIILTNSLQGRVSVCWSPQ
jgi:para-aminobenzoate synthetase / 4-amino-4-deoxychorismate lyase